jgi:hypothetical protein
LLAKNKAALRRSSATKSPYAVSEPSGSFLQGSALPVVAG